MVYDLERLRGAPVAEGAALPAPAVKRKPASLWGILRKQCVAVLVILGILLGVRYLWPASGEYTRKALTTEERGPGELAITDFFRNIFVHDIPLPEALSQCMQEAGVWGK